MRGEHGAELGVRGDRGVADAVDRGEAVAHPDRVQSPPGTFGEDAGVDLHVQVAVRVTGPGGVVPHHGCFDLGDRHLDLAALGSDPGGGVLGDPADDLLGRAGLCSVQGVGDLGMQRGRERPGLRAIHHNLDEPQRLRICSQPPFRGTGLDVEAGDPPLVGLPGEAPGRESHQSVVRRRTGWRRRCPRPGSSHRRGSGPARRRYGQLPVIRGRTSSHRARISPPTTSNNSPINDSSGRPKAARLTYFRSMRADVFGSGFRARSGFPDEILGAVDSQRQSFVGMFEEGAE